MKSPKSEAEPRRRKVGTIGGTVRPLIATIKQTLVTMPGINRLVPGGRKPVTHLYPYQKVELADYAREDLYYRADELRMPKENSDKEIVLINRIGEHPILEADVCIGCKKCERECPTRCIDMLDGPNDRKGKPIVIPEFDYTKCIGCQQCVDVCPVDCLHMEEIGYKDLEGFYHINLQGEVKLLEEQVEK